MRQARDMAGVTYAHLGPISALVAVADGGEGVGGAGSMGSWGSGGVRTEEMNLCRS